MSFSFPAFGFTVYVEIYRKIRPGIIEAADQAREADAAKQADTADSPKKERPVPAFFRKVGTHFKKH